MGQRGRQRDSDTPTNLSNCINAEGIGQGKFQVVLNPSNHLLDVELPVKLP
jgi:hypothetical protein